MRLSDFVDINPRTSLPKGTVAEFVPMEALNPQRRYVRTYPKKAFSGGTKFIDGDTLFARITPCLENGKISQFISDSNSPAFGSTEYWIFRAKDGVSDPAFVYYLAKSDTLRKPAEKSMVGASGRQRAQIQSVQDLDIGDIKLEDQQKIAGVLGAYDDLIENNLRRIEKLEAMARLLYLEMFSGADSVNRPKRKVEELIKRISPGKLYSQKNALIEGCVPIFDQGRSGIIGYHNDEPGVIASYDRPVITFANHTCYQRLIFHPFSAIQNVLPFLPANTHDIYWLHYATKDLIELNDYKGHWPEFMSKYVSVPGEGLSKKFGEKIKPMLVLIDKLEQSNQKLAQARVLLLPRLMSGEIEV